MKLTRRPRGWPLFVRIFALMLLTVLLVQIFNFMLVVVMPMPAPSVQPVARVAAALATGRDASGTLRLSIATRDPGRTSDPRDLRLAGHIATALSVPPEAVRVRKTGPLPRGIEPFERRHGPPPGFPPLAFRPDDGLLFGPFTVALRLPDGRWRTAEPVSTGFEPWRWRILVWLIVAILVVAPFAWILAHRLARPIGLFASAAERLGRDPRAPPLQLSGPPEIAEAAAAFNEMQARLNSYVRDRTTLLAAIAHDLRTPLMRLTMRLEHAPADLRRAAEEDILEMDQRIAAVMAFVRDMNRPTRRQKLDLRSLAESVTDEFADRGEAVTLAPGGAVVLSADRSALKALLANLIGNAVKYAGSADVSCHVREGQAVIEVVDAGPGMSEEDLALAFEPFFRGERSRGRESGGSGLGLASVRAVTRAHGGEVDLSNRPEGGMIARVSLPL